MSNLFNVDNGFFSFMGKLWDMICLSLIWAALSFYSFFIMVFLFTETSGYLIFPIFCILQGITAGPATAALYYTIVKTIRKERGYAYRAFFHSFKLNLKQGGIAGVLLITAALILSFDFQYAVMQQEAGSALGQFLYIGSMTLAVLLASVTVFLFPVLSRFTLKTAGLFRTTFLIAMKHIFTTILLLVIVVVTILAVRILPPLIIILPSVCILLMSFLIERVFKRYMPKDENAVESGKDEWYFD